MPSERTILRRARALLKPVRRRILVLMVVAVAAAGVAAALAARGGSSHPAQPRVTADDDANLMRALQRPKLVQKAP
jgi:hypothetical protein